MVDRVWVWHDKDYTVQHLTSPVDDVAMAWDGEAVCGLSGHLRRVTWENVDGGKACPTCTTEPFTLAGGDRGPP